MAWGIFTSHNLPYAKCNLAKEKGPPGGGLAGLLCVSRPVDTLAECGCPWSDFPSPSRLKRLHQSNYPFDGRQRRVFVEIVSVIGVCEIDHDLELSVYVYSYLVNLIFHCQSISVVFWIVSPRRLYQGRLIQCGCLAFLFIVRIRRR